MANRMFLTREYSSSHLSPAPRASETSASYPGADAPGFMLSRAPRAAARCFRFVSQLYNCPLPKGGGVMFIKVLAHSIAGSAHMISLLITFSFAPSGCETESIHQNQR